MKTAAALLTSALILCIVSAPLRAESPFDGNVEFMFGVFHGQMDEYVLQKGRAHELSRLEWDEHFVPYFDVRGEFEFFNVFACVSLLTAIPVRSGFMRNHDYTLAGSDALSHFSEHDALFDKHLEFYPELGYGVDVGRLWFGASAGFLYRNRKWTASGGYTQYPPYGQPWSESLPKEEQVGSIITYEETMWAPTATLYVDYTLNARFTLGGFVTFYPYIDVSTVDTHILRKKHFHDKMQGGFGLMPEVNVTYRPKSSDMVAFRFGVGYEGIFPAKGTAESGSIGGNTELALSQKTESKMTSNLFWAHFGFVIYPKKLVTCE